MQFLRGINDEYNNIKAHDHLMDPIPTITKKKIHGCSARTSTKFFFY